METEGEIKLEIHMYPAEGNILKPCPFWRHPIKHTKPVILQHDMHWKQGTNMVEVSTVKEDREKNSFTSPNND